MDWKKNRLSVALVALVVVSAAAVMAARSRTSVSELPEPNVNLPQVDAEAVDSVVLNRPDKPEVALEKRGDEWVMVRPVEAEADQDAVKQVVEKVAELEVGNVVSTNAALHERLEVTEGKAMRVQLSQGDEKVADLWIGPHKTDGTLVRAEGEDAVVAVRGAIAYPFNKDVHLYRNRVITDLDAKQVTALTMVHDDLTLKFVRDEPDGEWRQAEGEKPIEKFDPSRVQSLVSSFSKLRAAGFDEPDADAEARGLSDSKTRVTLQVAPEEEGGEPEVVELTLGKQHDGDQFSVARSGSDLPYRLSKYKGERLKADPEKFVKKPPPPPSTAGNMPHGPGGPGGPGGQQLPPELMKQLQQQMARQQR